MNTSYKGVPMKTRTVLTFFLVVLILATLTFIWGNSLKSKEASSAVSGGVLDMVRPVLELFVGQGNATDHLVRKIAHFMEYAALGGEFALLAALRRRAGLQGAVNGLFAGLGTAVIDESLQLLSRRGAQVPDILLDFCGVAFGLLGTLLLWAVFHARGKKRRSR